ncbi:HEAT repeat domain-containing protein [Nakamurella lactea]|uniref:HEAT repeat domain-containing protein n=1 Tax=Nakamurella lactea TaxID=459515 RepID=UPI0003FCA12F|nr:HEAT repeat domain-containing protein [Nakamurella lactea]
MTSIGDLQHPSSSVRLRTAMAAGVGQDDRHLEPLLRRCAVEPDFFVRDTLTWALTRYPAECTVPPLLELARSDAAQARSQALHTLSKIADPRGWSAISPEVLQDPDDEVATAAWRAAVVLVPIEQRSELAARLGAQLGRGGRDVQRSLSRAMVALGEAIWPVLRARLADPDLAVRRHAVATERLWRDPESGFDSVDQ